MTGIEFYQAKDLQKMVRRMMNGGWIAIGGQKAIPWVEETFYPPGTPENENFSLLIIPLGGGKVSFLAFGKPNAALQKFVHENGFRTWGDNRLTAEDVVYIVDTDEGDAVFLPAFEDEDRYQSLLNWIEYNETQKTCGGLDIDDEPAGGERR